MAARDRHGAAWMDTCHSDCCSRQGLEEVLNTVYRDERDLSKVCSIDLERENLIYLVDNVNS